MRSRALIFSLTCGLFLTCGLAFGQTATTTTLSSVTPAAPQFGRTVTLTATVSPALASGTISFLDGGTLVASSKLNGTSGVAQATTVALTPGAHSLRAVYGGNISYQPSQSAVTPFVVTPVAGAGFANAVTYGTGSAPTQVVVADFNGDGIADLASANSANSTSTPPGNNVSILLGNSNGTFQPAMNFPAGANPTWLAVGDFNGDGKLDLAISAAGSSATPTVGVLLGNGDGTFGSYQVAFSFTFPTEPAGILVGDFNGDGKADIAVVSSAASATGNISILLGNGSGGFATPVNYAIGRSPEAIATGDFNGDGKADVVVADALDNTVSVLLGNGDGTFQTATTAATGTTPWAVAVGDFNHDGAQDLAVTNIGVSANNVSVLLGNGNGTFRTPVNYPTGSQPLSVTVSDFNADGIPDLAVANHAAATVSVLLGVGDGTFLAAAPYNSLSPNSVAVGDFNGDGRPDLVTVNDATPPSAYVLLATAPAATTTTLMSGPNPSVFGHTVTFTANVLPSTAAGSVEFLSGSTPVGGAVLTSGTAQLGALTLPFGADSLHAIYNGAPGVSQLSASNTVGQTVGTAPVGASGFQTATNTGVGTSPVSVAAADFNGDGKADLAVANSSSGNVTVLLGNGSGGFSAASGSPLTAGSTPMVAAVGDFNGDGKADLAVANSGSGSLLLYYGNGDGTFQSPQPRTVASPVAIAVGDFNGDGKYDLAVAGAAGGVSILLGSTLQSPVVYPAGTNPVAVTTGDFNNDGRADLAVTDSSGTVSILLGLGNGSFQQPMSFPAGAGPQGIAVADFNADGYADVAVADVTGGNVSILLGNGNGTFQPAVSYPAGSGAFSVTVADLNADGKPDLLVANSTGGGVSFLLGVGNGTFGTAQPFPTGTGTNPVSITAADFNGDGRVDVATANMGTNNISVLLGTGGACTYTLNPTSSNPSGVAGSASVSVTANVGCSWTASSNASFLTITAGSSGNGNGTVTYSIAANSGSARVGTLTIGGQTFTVNQAGAPAMSLSQSVLNYGNGGGTITDPQFVTVSFVGSAPVAWTASSNQTNVQVSPTSGTGLGMLQITASAGPSATVTVTAPGAPNSPLTITANVANVTPGNPFGSFDTPLNNATGLAGSIAVTGWALDNIEVTGVDIWREPVAGEPSSPALILIGNATFVAGARPDVQALYPTTPFNYRAGWGYLLLTNELPNNGLPAGIGNGSYKLHAIAHNKTGASLDLGTKAITVNNAVATLPFGAIDTPGQGATVSGTVTNFGWALTPPTVGCPGADQPCIIPVNGLTIFVYVDGVALGNPVYNLARCDVDQLFPGYANSGSTNCAQNGIPPGPVGYFNLDTTQLTDGVHTIAWSVTDNAGKAQGIGSRYFTVAN